jgi:fatty-acyl-CoA synthase
LPRWDRELAGRLFARHQITHWTCIPTMIIDLFGSPNYKRFDLSSLRYLSGGGAAMPHAVAERLQQEFGLTFAEGYGLTETAAPSHANPPERAKLQCLGIPIFGVDSRIVDPDTLRELPPGQTGEIVTTSRATGAIRRPRRRRSSSSTASRSSAPATSATWTTRATSSSPTA